MDWFSWLSKTSLEPSLVYDYGHAFAHNELQAEDIAYFNHEFLQSMGISVAKHRLEILKLARKEGRPGSRGISKLVLAINKARKTIKKHISKMVNHEDLAIRDVPEQLTCQRQWKGALPLKCKTEKELRLEKSPITRHRRLAKSGPLDRGVQEKFMFTDRSLKLSGPLDGNAHERLVLACRSPRSYGTPDGKVSRSLVTSKSPQLLRPWDKAPASPEFYSDHSKERIVNRDYEQHSLWAALFQDMKPT